MNTRAHALGPRWWAALLIAWALLAGPALADEWTRGTVVLHEGERKLSGIQYQVRGSTVLVRHKYGDVSYDMSQVKELIPDGSKKTEDKDGDDAPAGPSGTEWHLRFALEPPNGFEVTRPASPIAVAQLRHKERDATLSVSVRPLEGDGEWDLPLPSRKRQARLPDSVRDQVLADLKTLYDKPPTPKLEVGLLHEAPVVRADRYIAVELGGERSDTRVNTEVRFRRLGYEYRLVFSVAQADEGAVKHLVDEALEAFSFLPPLEVTKDGYSDHTRGFAIDVPAPEWRLQALPFDDDRPVRMLTLDRRASIEVTVIAAGKDPAELLKQEFEERRRKNARFFNADPVQAGKQGGTAVTRYSFRDFREGESKQLQYKGLVAVTPSGRLLMFRGVTPLSDPDSPKIQAEIDKALASVRLLDPAPLLERLKQGREALTQLGAGVEAFRKRSYSEAIERYGEAVKTLPSFAKAYYLRGLAKKESGDFKGYRDDLEKAGDLDPGAGYTKPLANALRDEAAAAQRRKDNLAALELWVKVLSAEKKDPKVVQSVVQMANAVWAEQDKAKEYEKGVRLLEQHLRGVVKLDVSIADCMAKAYLACAQKLSAQKKYFKAKGWARKAKDLGKRLDNKNIERQAQSAYDQIHKASGGR